MTKVLVVDDEDTIGKSLEGALRDEGYDVFVALGAEPALQIIDTHKIDLALVDIWMPGRDGLQTLQAIHAKSPETKVVMMSGHATIKTAIDALKLGAVDFLEKPLDLHLLLETARRHLGAAPEVEISDSDDGAIAQINAEAFNQTLCRGRNLGQKTLGQSIVVYGQGLHTGKKSGLNIIPLPANSGIHFCGIGEQTAVPAHVNFVGSTGFATTIQLGATQAGTIEHVMSALAAYGISNALLKCNGEVPVLDGSAREFCSLIEKVGIIDQQAPWYELAVTDTVQVGNEKEFIRIEPGEGFVIDYTLRYPAPVGDQRMVYTLSSPEEYREQIAPARTFGFLKDVGYLQRQGLALGGRFDNFVLFGPEGPLNGALRFSDEPVRHKILDAIGDLFLLGRRLSGKITACMTGHSDNIALLRAIQAKLMA